MLLRLKRSARRLALQVGLGPAARRLRHRFPSPAMRRDRRDTEHLRLVLVSVLSPHSNYIDVGANVGSVLDDVVRLAPQGNHHAFEPIRSLAAQLQERFPTVSVHTLALSDVPGKREFTFVKSRPGYSGFRERTYPGAEDIEKIQVDAARLDDVLPSDYEPALIKIDVEGAELEVLRGARRTLERHKPVVVFEHGREGAVHYDTRPEDVFDLLVRELGLRLFDLDGGGPYDRDSFVAAFEGGRRWNYVARA
jgi:FkbM family methyltransferase